MQNKSHNHVHEPRTFSKGWTWSKLTTTSIRGTLTKRRYELIFRHGLKMITTKVVRMLYPQDTEHIGYNIQCDHYVHTKYFPENPFEKVFDEKQEKCNLNKNSKHESIKTLSRTYKYSKIFLGLIDKRLSIHITFKHVQSHKWNKHSLNKSLVCYVWVSNVE